MQILFLVDLHWTEKRALELPPMADVDLVLLGGDLTNFKGVDTARTVVDAIRERGPKVLSVCGNCDRPEIEEFLREEEIDLDRRCRSIDGVDVLGISAGLPFGNLPYERTEDEFREAACTAFSDRSQPRGVTILVSHQPPHGTRCDIAGGSHVGSHAVREAILEYEPDLVLSGHIHEAIAADRLGKSLVVNPGPWFAGNLYRFSVSNGELVLPKALRMCK